MKAYLILGTLLLSVNFHLAQDLIDDEDSSDEIDTEESSEEVYCYKIFNQEIMNEKFYNTPRIS
jgi:hypothetical protein